MAVAPEDLITNSIRTYAAPRWRGWSAVGLVFGVDAALRRARRVRAHVPVPVVAALDEPAHLVTALLPLAVQRRKPAFPFLVGTVLGAVLIDLDHLPGLLGNGIRGSTQRPVPHSLASVSCAALGVACMTRTRRQFALGLTYGLMMHLVRDMATGGVPLFWPLSARTVRLPYAIYAGALMGCAWVTQFAPWDSRAVWRPLARLGADRRGDSSCPAGR